MSVQTAALEEREVNSEYGQVWVSTDGGSTHYYQQDIVAFTGTLALGRNEVPVAGSDQTVYRRSRLTRDGTMSYRKADSRWERFMLSFLSIDVNTRRALRAAGLDAFPKLTLMLVLDDPDAWGAEIMQINQVQFWSMSVGYSGADLIQRDMPVTWQSEQLLLEIPRPGLPPDSIDTLDAQSTLFTYNDPTTGQPITSPQTYGQFPATGVLLP